MINAQIRSWITYSVGLNRTASCPVTECRVGPNHIRNVMCLGGSNHVRSGVRLVEPNHNQNP